MSERQIAPGDRFRAREAADGQPGTELEVTEISWGQATYPDGRKEHVAFAELRPVGGATKLFVRMAHLEDPAIWEWVRR